MSKRRYGGLLIATLPCGRVCALSPLAGGESLTQVYALLSRVVRHRSIRYVIYDNACALGRFIRHPSRCHRTDASARMAAMTYVIDGLHVQGHTACTNPSHNLYMPEVLRTNHEELNGVNTQTSEQFFAWADGYCNM
eukprot:1413142-Karenia_brevis.AAC.1